RLSTGEVLQLDGVNTAGAVCSPNGLVSRDATGAILSCQSGVWKSQDSGHYTDVAMWETTSTKGVTYQVPGVHKYCFIS
ncbi:shufflon system plasmid conjugative transfer pilus tip adhesin PilV, partial [Enterobacter roggenkampii]